MPGNSWLHKLDPRTKIFVSIVVIWAIFLLKSPADFGFFGLFIFSLFIWAGVFKSLWRVVRPGFFLVGITVLMNMMFTPGEVLFPLGPFALTKEGMVQGLTIGGRLLYLISFSSLLTLTTSPVRLTDGIEKLLLPFKKIKFPASELAMMMNIALRFIPTFWEETEKIIRAQISRGADFKSKDIKKRFKYMTALLVPLFISAFKRADEYSIALEARGYFVGMQRTSLYELKFGIRDYITFCMISAGACIYGLYKYGLLK